MMRFLRLRPVRVCVGICLAATMLAFLAACGGGGGGISQLTLSGDALVPSGTSRQAAGGYALANATVKAYIWPDLSNAIAQSTTDANGHYVLTLPNEAAGKDIVVVATKQVGDKTVRVACISPDIPQEGRQGVNLDAITTFATEEIARIREQEGLNDLSPGGVATVVEQIRERLRDWNGDLSDVLPPEIGGGLRGTVGEQVQNQVQNIVQQHKGALKGSTGNPDVDTARSMVQMVRDMMGNVMGAGESEASSIDSAVNLTSSALDAQLAATEAFADRFGVMMEMLGKLDRETPGKYHLMQDTWGMRYLKRVGDVSDGKTWEVTSQVSGESNGLVMTVRVQNSIADFHFDPAAGKYTVTATKTGVSYQMTLTPTISEASKTISLSASINLQDSALNAPLTFEGTLVATLAEIPAAGAEPKFTSATFNGTLRSQFGDAQVSNLKVEFEPDSSAKDSLKRITLGSLQAQIMARPVSISLQNVDMPFMELNGGGTAPSNVSVNTVQVTGRDENDKQISLTISNVSATFIEYRDPVNGVGSGVIKSLQGKLNFASDRLSLSGEVNGTWNNPVPFGSVSSSGHSLSTFPDGTIHITGNMTPKIGKPAAVNITLTSTPKATPPKISLDAVLTYGAEEMDISASLGLVEGSNGVEPGDGSAVVTHSPSGMKMEWTLRRNEPPVGTVKKADGTKVADIGEAQSLGIAELGRAGIIKYSDGTFETLESLLP